LIVLSIHDGHDSGACLLRDGQVLGCCSEERRVNVKNYAGMPHRSIEALFKQTGIDPKDVNLVALSGKVRTTSPTREPKRIYSVLRVMYSLARTELATSMGRWVLSRMRRRKVIFEFLARIGMGDVPTQAYDHHQTHAACAYYHRPFTDDAVILTLDGAGDGLCSTVSVGSGLKMRVIASTPKFHSPALGMYSMITSYLGLRPFEHEYKVMGMAPYGQARYCDSIIREMFSVEGLRFRNRTGRIGHRLRRYYAKQLYCQRFDNVSAACQLVFEEMMVQWVTNAIQATGLKKVVCAGGAFLNVKANKLIREMDQVDALYVYPASDDGGTPVGAAILGYLDLCEQKNQQPTLDLPKTMYLGLEFSEQEMEQAAKASGFPYERMSDPADEVASLLADGKIVARFNGREELGPRSLGNRSILADPRDLRVIRKLNFAIKMRDFWMPFAASVLQEDGAKYIKGLTDWPFYMIEAFDTTAQAPDDMLAGLHPFDLTVRPQIVNELNPSYQALLRAFRAKTGVGVLLNTSFNLHGFPIVGTPAVALDTLANSELDAVALGPFLVRKRPA